jgi:hypothetical protein
MVDRKFVAMMALSAAACGSSSGSTTASAPSAAPQLPATMTIAEVTPATVIVDGVGTYGQSLTVSASYAFNSLRFTWLDRSGVGLPITGTMQIYTREYLGLPKDMGPSASGFLARSVRIDGTSYVFDDNVTLNPGTKYWFLEDGANHFTAVYTTQPTPDYYPGGDFYTAAVGPLRMYGKLYLDKPGDSTYDANFRLTGHPFFP